jgi:hypothetical protein
LIALSAEVHLSAYPICLKLRKDSDVYQQESLDAKLSAIITKPELNK